jgi:hypothetical protein
VSGFRCQVSGVRAKDKGGNGVTDRNFMDVENLEVYKNLYVE